LRWLGLATERDAREHLRLLDEYSRTVVNELRDACAASGAGADGGAPCGGEGERFDATRSFVGLFLADARKRGQDVSEDYLRDLVLNFLIAGRDTTAQALSWTIFCLATHPAAEEKARQEVIDVRGESGLSYEDLNSLPYLQAVLSEALRLYPSVPVDIKSALEDDTWPDGSKIPAQTSVMYNIYAMGHDPQLWGEDAEAFRPERWLEMAETPDNYHYPVFNGGPRECLGRRLAMVEMKTCLAVLLPELSLKLAVPADQVQHDSQLTLGMGRGLPCYVEVRGSDIVEPSPKLAGLPDHAQQDDSQWTMVTGDELQSHVGPGD